VARKARVKIGITVVATSNAVQTLWASGMGQNIAFLALLMRRLDIIDSVFLVSCPNGNSHPLGELFGIPVIPLDDALAQMDIIVEFGSRVTHPVHVDALHKHGGKLITYIAGNTLVMCLEAIARESRNGDVVSQMRYDAAWVLPHHWETNHAYTKLTMAEKTSVAPYIWDPICMMQAAYSMGRNPFYKKPEGKGWLVGTFEPNVNVVKTFHLPLLITENAYRLQPDLISRIMLFCASHLQDTAHAKELFASLKLGQDGKILPDIRRILIETFGGHVNAVVTHQWQNQLNNLYFEVLYLGWPFIHNSLLFEDVGYYYPEFDVKKGAEIMVHGLNNHDEIRAKQAGLLKDTFWKYSIENHKVQARYTELIEEALS